MNALLQDLKYAVRMLVKSPGFSAVAVLTLALGIGANTAIFSLMDAVLLKSLPVKNAKQLVLFTWDDNKWPPKYGQTGWDSRFSFSYPEFDTFQKQNTTLSSVFTFAPLGSSADNTAITVDGDAGLANGVMVSGEFFSGLGVAPLLGRGITEQDADKGAPRVAVISYNYWTRRFGRDPGIVGRHIQLNDMPFTIVGVTPADFSGLQPGLQPDVYLAFDDLPNLRPWSEKPSGGDSFYATRNWVILNIFGRLKPGVSLRRAQSELNVMFHNFLAVDWKPGKQSDYPAFTLTPGGKGIPSLSENFGQPLEILMVLVGLALLIACANVATLLLARASARQKEVSVRLALGASRARLLRQLLTESVMLSVLGGAVGLLFAGWGTNMLTSMFSGGMQQIALNVRPDLIVLLFTFGVAVLTGVLFGLAPALRASRLDLASVMKEATTSVTAGREKHRLSNSLVVAQVAASLVLMVGAGLFVRTLENYEHENYGFNQNHLLTFGIDATRQDYQGDRLINLYQEVQDRVRALPGVTAATTMDFAPFSGWSSNTEILLDNKPAQTGNDLRWMRVGSDFFSTMEIPVVLGRALDRRDTATSPLVVVVDENFVKKYYPHENPIGHHFSLSARYAPTEAVEIVGVCRPAELTNVHADPRPKAYAPYSQYLRFLNTVYFELRTAGDPTAVVSELRDAMRDIDPGLPLMGLKTQTEERDEGLVQERLFARLSLFFGLLALALAMIGLYGTMSYAVARKTHEIGIRMTLGAEPAHVLRMVVGSGVKLAAIGAAIGVVLALSTAGLARSVIFGVTPDDPVTLIAAAAVLMLVAAVACYVPARRAMKVDPMIALRYE